MPEEITPPIDMEEGALLVDTFEAYAASGMSTTSGEVSVVEIVVFEGRINRTQIPATVKIIIPGVAVQTVIETLQESIPYIEEAMRSQREIS